MYILTLQTALQMDVALVRKIPFLLLRDGRYYARRVVSQELRSIIGKNELREPLGSDRRLAIERLPIAMVKINAQIDHARMALAAQLERNGKALAARSAPMSEDELARMHYQERLDLDLALRDLSDFWAGRSIDQGYVADTRAIAAGRASNEQIDEILGDVLRKYARRGNIAAEFGSTDWRRIARILADAELEALARTADRDEGIAIKDEHHPSHLAPVRKTVEIEPFVEPVSLRGLLDDHLKSLEAAGRGRSARKAWTPVFEDLISFVKQHRGLKGGASQQADDARRLTAEEIIAWRDAKLAVLSPKTVKDVYIASLKSVLARSVEDRKLVENAAANVKVRASAAPVTREKGFTDTEAASILMTCLNYVPADHANPANRESPHVTASKRWGPWLCALTGARVGEVLQLRKSDVREVDGIRFVRLTPEAGTVKARSYRDVPIHAQLTELGFLDFVARSEDGPLFYAHGADASKLPAQAVYNRIAKWLRALGLIPDGVSPNHGWRHRFKTLAREAGLDPRVVDAIQGHTGRTASDGYGDVTLRAKKAAIDKLDTYKL